MKHKIRFIGLFKLTALYPLNKKAKKKMKLGFIDRLKNAEKRHGKMMDFLIIPCIFSLFKIRIF